MPTPSNTSTNKKGESKLEATSAAKEQGEVNPSPLEVAEERRGPNESTLAKGDSAAGSGEGDTDLSKAKQESLSGNSKSGTLSLAGGLLEGGLAGDNDRTSPQEARRRAGEMQKRSQELERQGNSGQAFEAALKAWQLVRVHEHDSGCCALASELEQSLARLGEAANLDSNRYRAKGKRVRIE